MRQSMVFAVSVLVVASGWISSSFRANAQSPVIPPVDAEASVQGPRATPVDFRACRFRAGKGMDDLQEVSGRLRAFANENDFDYSAWMLTPQFHSGTSIDLVWLGAWPNGEAFGVSMERWNKTEAGKALQADFNKVLDCSDRRELAASLPLSAAGGTPEDGILMFYACALNEGKTLAEAYAAHLDASQVMKALGSLAVSWMFQPAAGADDLAFDYYHVVGFYRYSDMGATMEMYANGGGREAQQKILGEVTHCNTPNIYDAVSVRARDER
jgi:hypothetical protein